MAGNGYFAEGRYQPKSTETWADLTGGWDTYNSSWQFTPNLPLTFTTNVIDIGRNAYVNFYLNLDIEGVSATTVYYGDTVDSAGGDIDSPSSVSVTPGSSVSGVKARYFQFALSVNYADSAGQATPEIFNIVPTFSSEVVNETASDVNSNTLGGSVGARELTLNSNLSKITSCVIQPHYSSTTYVTADYVATDYVEEGTVALPKVLIDKTTDPITLNIFELDTFGKTKRIDCVFDAIVQGLPAMVGATNGGIERG